MTAIARALSRAIGTINDIELLKQLVLFCAAGLFVALLMLTYGLDLSPGFVLGPLLVRHLPAKGRPYFVAFRAGITNSRTELRPSG